MTSGSSGTRGVRPSSHEAPASLALRVLAIDGGGIRGVIPARFLAELERRLGEALERIRAAGEPAEVAARWAGIDTPRIADCFHLIAGTSTGGLLAAGLTATDRDGRPKLTAAQAAALYADHGAEIFHRPLVRQVLDHFELLAPKYPLAQLRRVLERDDVFGATRLRDARTEVLILSFDAARPGPRYFTRWAAREMTMAQVAQATAAAPTYFEPLALGSSRLIDGGVFAGDPALGAIALALRRTAPPTVSTPSEIFMISLGTGAFDVPLNYGGGGIIGWLQPRTGGEALLEALLGGSGDYADELAHMLLNGAPAPGANAQPKLPPDAVGGGPQLWRYQPLLPEPYGLDDVSALPALERIASAQIDRYRDELAMFARALIEAGPVPA
jgi:hypothetical protein